MTYLDVHKARFLARPNRFIARVILEETGEEVTVHVKNTGRCRELLIPGSSVYLERSGNPARKTTFDLIAVEKAQPGGGRLLINMDSQAPNQVFREWAQQGNLTQGLTLLRPETTWGNSRFDFYWEALERHGFVEVKGVTLEENGVALFPDAPTERGLKHLEELTACLEAGYRAAVCFVIQMAGARYFSPNDRTHPAFGDALRRAARAGVEILAYDCAVAPDSLRLQNSVEVRM